MSSIDKTEANRRNSKGESGIRLAVGPHSQGSGSLRMFLEFPGGSAVRTLRFHCQGGGFSHWLGNWDLQALRRGQKECPATETSGEATKMWKYLFLPSLRSLAVTVRMRTLDILIDLWSQIHSSIDHLVWAHWIRGQRWIVPLHYCHTIEKITSQCTRLQTEGKLLYSTPRVMLRGDIISWAIMLALILKKSIYIFFFYNLQTVYTATF